MTVPVFVDVDHWPSDSWNRDFVYMPVFAEVLTITWSTCVVDGLRLIEQTPGVEMVWCTTWKHRAPTLLSPVIGLGAEWEYKDELITDAPRWFDWWKATRAFEALVDADRVVWIDDDIASWISMLKQFGRDDEWDWTLDEHICCISPRTSHALTPDDLDVIERFLKS